MYKILILGPQGCGKGTQARILSQKLGIPEFSMGALLREAAAEGGEFGARIAAIQASGHLVSDEDALAVLKRRLAHDDAKDGYILDGYPRNEAQYRAYIGFDHPTAVVVIHVPREVSLERLAMRASHDTRSDDNPEATAKRLEIYERETLPMVDHFRAMDVVHDIDGNGTIDEVAEQIEKIFS